MQTAHLPLSSVTLYNGKLQIWFRWPAQYDFSFIAVVVYLNFTIAVYFQRAIMT